MNIFFFETRMLCFMTRLHTNTHTVRGRPTPKKGMRRFRDGLVLVT